MKIKYYNMVFLLAIFLVLSLLMAMGNGSHVHEHEPSDSCHKEITLSKAYCSSAQYCMITQAVVEDPIAIVTDTLSFALDISILDPIINLIYKPPRTILV